MNRWRHVAVLLIGGVMAMGFGCHHALNQKLLMGVLSKGRKMRGVATNVYLWKTSEKPKETDQNKNSKFGSCIYARGRY